MAQRRYAKKCQHILDSIRHDVAGQVGALLWDAEASSKNAPRCRRCGGTGTDPETGEDDDGGQAAAPIPA